MITTIVNLKFKMFLFKQLYIIWKMGFMLLCAVKYLNIRIDLYYLIVLIIMVS